MFDPNCPANGLVLEGFAGPGGWSTGARIAGHTGFAVGIEHDMSACRTAVAAGHHRIRADVATFPLGHLAGRVDGVIQSPPCQPWSAAGDRRGEQDRPAVHRRIDAFFGGHEPEVYDWADPRSPLCAEPMRWAVALRPRWIALEQVPAVLPLWEYMAALLRRRGYHVWTGILDTERYGVPQTRRRAFLVARRDGIRPSRPVPTHQGYRTGREPDSVDGLFEPLPPPVSMAQALGWGVERPAWTVTGGGTEGGGGVEVFGNADARRLIAQAPSGAEWVMRSGQCLGGDPDARAERDVDDPALTVTSTVDRNRWVLRGGRQENATEREMDEPAGTVLSSRVGNINWVMRNGNQANACERRACERRACEPAGTLFFGQRTNAVDWVCRDARMYPAGLHGSYDYSRSVGEPSPTIKGGGSGGQYVSDGETTVRVTVEEAALLQSFPAGYPWQGTRSAMYRQVGDAVPPILAAAVLRPLLAVPQGWTP